MTLSEPESHSHRSDQEWRAIVRTWKEAVGEIEVYADHPMGDSLGLHHYLGLIRSVAKTLREKMERESK